MAITTGKIEWRSGYSPANLYEKLCDFALSAGWTILARQNTNPTAPEALPGLPYKLFITKNRGSGFRGDNPIVLIFVHDYQKMVQLKTCESVTIAPGGANNANGWTYTAVNETPDWWGNISLETSDADLYVSADDAFFVMAAIRNNAPVSTAMTGIFALERATGDVDGGTFYGHWRADTPTTIRVPGVRDKNRVLGANIDWSTQTPLGGASGLTGVNEAGNDVMWSLTPWIGAWGKMKRQVNGIRICTSNKFTTGSTTGADKIDGYKWMFINRDSGFCMAMPIADTILTATYNGGFTQFTTQQAPPAPSSSYGGGSGSPSAQVFSPVVDNAGSDLTAALISDRKVWTQASSGKKIFGTGNTVNLVEWSANVTPNPQYIYNNLIPGNIVKYNGGLYFLRYQLSYSALATPPDQATDFWVYVGPASGNEAWRLFDTATDTIHVSSGADAIDSGISFTDAQASSAWFAQYVYNSTWSTQGFRYAGFINPTAKVITSCEVTRASSPVLDHPTWMILEASNNTTNGADGDWSYLADAYPIDWTQGNSITFVPVTQTAYKAYRILVHNTFTFSLQKMEVKGV